MKHLLTFILLFVGGFNVQAQIAELKISPNVITTDKNGGVISKMKVPVWFGLGSPMGSGEQLMPWIHVDDLCEIIIHCIENKLNGTYNAVAACDPNKEVMRALAKAMHRPFFMPKVPAQLFKWLYGEMSVLILGSVNASNDKIRSTGFNFRYPKIQEAVKQILRKLS